MQACLVIRKCEAGRENVDLYRWAIGTNFWNLSVNSLLRVDTTLFFIVVLASQPGSGEEISICRFTSTRQLVVRNTRRLSLSLCSCRYAGGFLDQGHVCVHFVIGNIVLIDSPAALPTRRILKTTSQARQKWSQKQESSRAVVGTKTTFRAEKTPYSRVQNAWGI